MAKRKPTGMSRAGRKPGSLNKMTLAREHVLQVLADKSHDPFEALASMAIDPDTPKELKYQCNRELASYLVPKFRPVDGQNASQAFAFNISIARPARDQDEPAITIDQQSQ